VRVPRRLALGILFLDLFLTARIDPRRGHHGVGYNQGQEPDGDVGKMLEQAPLSPDLRHNLVFVPHNAAEVVGAWRVGAHLDCVQLDHLHFQKVPREVPHHVLPEDAQQRANAFNQRDGHTAGRVWGNGDGIFNVGCAVNSLGDEQNAEAKANATDVLSQREVGEIEILGAEERVQTSPRQDCGR
jgi:hypothetical protein